MGDAWLAGGGIGEGAQGVPGLVIAYGEGDESADVWGFIGKAVDSVGEEDVKGVEGGLVFIGYSDLVGVGKCFS